MIEPELVTPILDEDQLAAIEKQLNDPPMGYIELGYDAYPHIDGEPLILLSKQLLGEIQRLRAGIATLRREHLVLEDDCWWSCPQSRRCCDPSHKDDPCDCACRRPQRAD